MPLVSFVIPAHNVEPYLKQCLDSILSCTRDDIEAIVVDDGSTDGTRAVIETFASGDARVQLLTHDTALGPGPTRNDGLEAARGDFVWFVDADDWLFDGALEHVLPHLRADVDLLCVNFARVWDDGRTVGAQSRTVLARAPATPFTLREWPEIAKILHTAWNKIVKRSLLAEHSITFPVGLGEDIVFTFAVLAAAKAIEVEQFVCYAWRTGRPGQLTQREGQDNLVWSDQWRAALESCSLEPVEVRAVVSKRMIRHGWSVLSDPVRLRGRLRAEFFRRFSALYCERRGPGLPRNIFLASGSWNFARLRLLPRQVRARLPPQVLLVRDRVRSLTIGVRRALTH